MTAEINFHRINSNAVANSQALFELLWSGRLPGRPTVHVKALNPACDRRLGRLVITDPYRGTYHDTDGNVESGNDLIDLVANFAQVGRIEAALWLQDKLPPPPAPAAEKAAEPKQSPNTVHDRIVSTIEALDASRDQRHVRGVGPAPYPPSRRK